MSDHSDAECVFASRGSCLRRLLPGTLEPVECPDRITGSSGRLAVRVVRLCSRNAGRVASTRLGRVDGVSGEQFVGRHEAGDGVTGLGRSGATMILDPTERYRCLTLTDEDLNTLAVVEQPVGLPVDVVQTHLHSADGVAKPSVDRQVAGRRQRFDALQDVALHLARRAGQSSFDVTIETLAGAHHCLVDNRPGEESVVVQMAPPSLMPRDLPLSSDKPWLDHPLTVGEHTVRLSGVSMGNPHAVTFDDIGEARRALGPAIQQDPHFPEGVNVGLVSEQEGNEMRLTLDQIKKPGLARRLMKRQKRESQKEEGDAG